jgi:hypothetical protein
MHRLGEFWGGRWGRGRVEEAQTIALALAGLVENCIGASRGLENLY